VLGGSISDAMLPLDRVKSEAPPLRESVSPADGDAAPAPSGAAPSPSPSTSAPASEQTPAAEDTATGETADTEG